MSATNPVEELQDELLCPICLGSFKEPVILDCEHNFCHACITEFWKVSDTGVCPQCRKKSLSERKLRPNKQLETVVDIARDLEGECKKHGEVFNLFCKEDRTLICMVCRESQEHKTHRVIPLETAAEECKEQLESHLTHFQQMREWQVRQRAAQEEEYQTLLTQTESRKQEIVSAFKQAHQILKQGEQFMRNSLDGTIKDLVKTRNKNNRCSDKLLLLDNLIAEINQKRQQPVIECLKDIDSTLSRCEKMKGEEEPPVDSLTELGSRVQAVFESQKVICDLLKNFRVELVPELGSLENLLSDVQGQVSCEDPAENVPNKPEQDDTFLCKLDYEDGKCSSNSCEEQEVVPTVQQNNMADFINVVPEEVIGHWFDSKFGRRGAWKTIAAITVLLAAVLLAVVLGTVWSGSKVCVTPVDIPGTCCPENWIGYQGKCYFFSEDEANWTWSQHFCSSHGASLAGLDTLKEKDFLMRHKGSLDPWISLRREPDQPWKWPNGSVFNYPFQIGGGGECAYIYEIIVSSSRCYTKRNWICSKPDEFTKRKIT
ncbi:E3 ubiquitin-protein ligase TRIM39-like [Emydura macquarii macquarii]|uniref:E3 ubiquitin-protein ligase TRIM39-like n=1 Tax=Emydura macquarii macquarii TaxID=1129001 RepID=UPI003529E5CF